MFLLELDATHPISDAIVVTTQQLQSELDSGSLDKNMTVPELLKYYRNYDIILNKDDLYNMIEVPPLNQVISNIQGDKIIWKGEKSEPNAAPPPAPEDQKKIVKQMAKKTLPK